VDLRAASLTPLIPISQAPDSEQVLKPLITVINDHEFLVCSWSGAGTMGLFINSNGEPVRGTLEWPTYPEAICTPTVSLSSFWEMLKLPCRR
jgi:vacuolar protein sorting-associated protein 3